MLPCVLHLEHEEMSAVMEGLKRMQSSVDTLYRKQRASRKIT